MTILSAYNDIEKLRFNAIEINMMIKMCMGTMQYFTKKSQIFFIYSIPFLLFFSFLDRFSKAFNIKPVRTRANLRQKASAGGSLSDKSKMKNLVGCWAKQIFPKPTFLNLRSSFDSKGGSLSKSKNFSS